MDMKHDFPPEPEVRPDIQAEKNPCRFWSPELLAIAIIFVSLWVAFGAHYLSSV